MTKYIYKENKKFTYGIKEDPCGLMVYVLDGNHEVTEFELYSRSLSSKYT